MICIETSQILESFESMMTNLGSGKWQCLICGLQSKSTNVRYHIEAKHLQPTQSYSCQYCDDVDLLLLLWMLRMMVGWWVSNWDLHWVGMYQDWGRPR